MERLALIMNLVKVNNASLISAILFLHLTIMSSSFSKRYRQLT